MRDAMLPWILIGQPPAQAHYISMFNALRDFTADAALILLGLLLLGLFALGWAIVRKRRTMALLLLTLNVLLFAVCLIVGSVNYEWS